MIDWLNRIFGRNDERDEGAPARAAQGSNKAVLQGMMEEFRAAKQLYAQGDIEAAAERFEVLLARKHNWADAHRWLGICRLGQGRAEDAYDAFVMALHFEPDAVRSRYGMALAEQALGRNDDAMRTLDALIDAHQDHADAYNMRGGLRLARKNPEGAKSDFEQALRVDPAHVKGHINLGVVLFCDLGDYERGAHHIERALQLDPDNRDAQCNLALVLSHRGDDAAALALCNRLLDEDPQNQEARLQRALVNLRRGCFEAAWDDYEARKLVRSSYVHRSMPWPEWTGGDAGDKTILVFGEQGLGDEVMFASCVPEVVEHAKRVVIECSPRLHALFQRSFPAATVVAGVQSASLPAWAPQGPHIDAQLPAGSLPRLYRRRRDDFPKHRGYLVPDAARVRHWRDRLSSLGGEMKVGISWRGGLRSTRGSLRSLELAVLASHLSMPNVRLIDLQYGDTGADRVELDAQGIQLSSWPEAIADLDETAALIASLDLVVTVCTTVVHLAGALGRNVWVLVPDVPEWRYLSHGERMPWYPSARLYRRSPGEGWEAVLARVATALRDHISCPQD